jgi:transforming growth factor-beta-induced protein
MPRLGPHGPRLIELAVGHVRRGLDRHLTDLKQTAIIPPVNRRLNGSPTTAPRSGPNQKLEETNNVKLKFLLALSALAIVAAACSPAATTAPATPTVAPATPTAAPVTPTAAPTPVETAMALGDIVETATAAGSFTTLLKAATAAGLVDTLKGPGPFTVFAPTDAAFAALPAGTLDSLLADPAALKNILLYHVVSGAVDSTAVVKLTSATAVNGDTIKITVKDGVVYLNDTVKVTMVDIKASNGIIHVIDAVLLPPTK